MQAKAKKSAPKKEEKEDKKEEKKEEKKDLHFRSWRFKPRARDKLPVYIFPNVQAASKYLMRAVRSRTNGT